MCQEQIPYNFDMDFGQVGGAFTMTEGLGVGYCYSDIQNHVFFSSYSGICGYNLKVWESCF